jgi:hypothetical protein
MEAEYKYGWSEESDLPLIQKLKQDLKHSMLHKHEVVRDAIRVIISEFPRKITVPIVLGTGKKSSRPKKDEEIKDDEIIAVILGLVKSEKQTMELKKEEESKYLEQLELYLPKKVSPAEIKSWIGENIDFSQVKNPMQAMGLIMKHFGKKADGNTVKDILKDITGKE